MIASNALFYLLWESTVSPKIRGIRLPNERELLNVQFTNDTSIFPELDKENMESLMMKLEVFFMASRERVNNRKSIALG